jgi:methionine synthase II (cobalamin-independent)
MFDEPRKITLMIHLEIEIEDLVRNYPFSVKYLMEKGIKCIACGEPIWGTLAEAAAEKGFSVNEIQGFVSELNEIAEKIDVPEKDA